MQTNNKKIVYFNQKSGEFYFISNIDDEKSMSRMEKIKYWFANMIKVQDTDNLTDYDFLRIVFKQSTPFNFPTKIRKELKNSSVFVDFLRNGSMNIDNQESKEYYALFKSDINEYPSIKFEIGKEFSPLALCEAVLKFIEYARTRSSLVSFLEHDFQ